MARLAVPRPAGDHPACDHRDRMPRWSSRRGTRAHRRPDLACPHGMSGLPAPGSSAPGSSAPSPCLTAARSGSRAAASPSYPPGLAAIALRCLPRPGVSCFLRDGDRVFHTYSTFARGTDQLGSSYTLLDLTALGRMEDWEEPKGRVSRPHGADPSFTD